MSVTTDTPITEATFCAVYTEAAGALLAFLRSRCRSEEEAAELTQEAFCQAWIKRANYSGRSSLKTWIFAIGLNVWRQQCRKRKFAALDEPALEAVAAPQEPQYPGLEQEEIRLVVASAISSLPAEWREAFQLVRVEELSYIAAAAKAGITVEALRMRLYRATQKLAQELQAYKDLIYQ